MTKQLSIRLYLTLSLILHSACYTYHLLSRSVIWFTQGWYGWDLLNWPTYSDTNFLTLLPEVHKHFLSFYSASSTVWAIRVLNVDKSLSWIYEACSDYYWFYSQHIKTSDSSLSPIVVIWVPILIIMPTCSTFLQHSRHHANPPKAQNLAWSPFFRWGNWGAGDYFIQDPELSNDGPRQV